MSADIRPAPRVKANITEGELACLEDIVRSGMQAFVAVGLALVEIRKTRGYRLRGFETFEDYCRETFKFSARHGQRMMAAAKTAQAVAGATGEQPKDEYAARALVPVAGDTAALAMVKRRLEQRGLKLSEAPGGLIVSLLIGGHERSENHAAGRTQYKIGHHAARADGESDVCPRCGQRPGRYFYRPQEGGWLCSHCNGAVVVIVKSR